MLGSERLNNVTQYVLALLLPTIVFLLFLLRENFWDFRIFCSCYSASEYNRTYTRRDKKQSIFSTPNDDGRRQ